MVRATKARNNITVLPHDTALLDIRVSIPESKNIVIRDELTQLTHTIARRVGRYLEDRGLLERDTDNCYLMPEAM